MVWKLPMDINAAKAAASQQLYTSTAAITVADSPPLTQRVERMLDEALGVLSDTNGSLSALNGRLFGFPPPSPTNNGLGAETPESAVFESRVVDRLIHLLALARTARDQASELATRI